VVAAGAIVEKSIVAMVIVIAADVFAFVFMYSQKNEGKEHQLF
jgi:hypothetical protein